MIVGMSLVVAILASKPTASEAFTVKGSGNWQVAGSMVQSTSIPSESQVFELEEEVLTSITTSNFGPFLC